MFSSFRLLLWYGVAGVIVWVVTVAIADEKNVGGVIEIREATLSALQPIGSLIGEWKGVGQPKRGSNVGAWSEKAHAAWRFETDRAELVVSFEPGQQFHKAIVSLAPDGKTPALNLVSLNREEVSLVCISQGGDKEDKDESWIFESPEGRWPQTRCTVRLISEIRVTFLFEEKPTEKSAYRRLSEIGLTRAGARLADGNTGERQCIVTGGLGTIKVSYEGKTYYVCCEGCKQAFDEDPAGTLEAYRERLKDAVKK